MEKSKINPLRSIHLNATTLIELCDALRYLKEEDPHNDLFYSNDLTSLPTFGGEEPADTTDIWSWDSENFLVYEDEWRISPRSDYIWKEYGND